MKTLILLVIASLVPATLTRATIVAQYTFAGSPGTTMPAANRVSVDTELNSVASSFTDGPGLIAASSSSGNPAPSYAVTTTHLSGVFTANDYATFSVSAADGYWLNLTSLTFDVQNAGGAPLPDGRWVIRSSLDSFSTDLATFDATGTFANKSLALTGPAFQKLSTISFRMHLYDDDNTSSGTKSLRTDNVILNGSVVLIPEPSTLFLLSCGGWLAWRWRRRS